MFTQTKPLSKFPAYCRPLIQTLRMQNKDNQIKFSDRFQFDCMGAHEFERGLARERIIEMNESSVLGAVTVDGCEVLICYSPKHFASHREVELYLNDIYHGAIRTHEPSYFNQEYRRETARLRKEHKADNNPLKQRPDRVDCWFDIERGLFWTFEKINIKDLRLNLRKSVQYIDDQKAAAVQDAQVAFDNMPKIGPGYARVAFADDLQHHRDAMNEQENPAPPPPKHDRFHHRREMLKDLGVNLPPQKEE